MRKTIRKLNFQRPGGEFGGKYRLSVREKRAIRRESRDAVRAVAARHGVSYEWLRQQERALSQTYSRAIHKRREQAAANLDLLARTIIEKFGWTGATAESLAAATVNATPAVQSAKPADRDDFHRALLAALRRNMPASSAPVDSTWLN